jgi:hypothetical protein
VHEPENGINVAFVYFASTQLWELVVLNGIHTVSESPVRLEFHLQKARQFAVLKPPKVLSSVNFTRHETSPKGCSDKPFQVRVSFDEKVRIKLRPEGDGPAILGTTKDSDRKLFLLILAIPSNCLEVDHLTFLAFYSFNYMG